MFLCQEKMVQKEFALFIKTYELAALFLGRGDDRQPVRDELRAQHFGLEQRIPHRRLYPAGYRPAPARLAAAAATR